MNKISVFGDDFGKLLAKKLNADFSKVERRTFPDGEVQPRILKETGRTAVLAIRKRKDEHINSYLVNFILLARKLKERHKVVGVMPYLPYARQDKVFREGEPLSAKYIAEMIEKNIDAFVTVNMHEHRKKIGEIFSIHCKNISVFGEMGKKFKAMKDKIVVGPDGESGKFAEEFAKEAGCGFVVLKKERDVSTGNIRINHAGLREIKGKNAIIVDDMVAYGSTIIDAALSAKRAGAKSVSLAFVHGLLLGDSEKTIKTLKPLKIMSSNTLENDLQGYDVSGEIARTITKLFK
jgi:ribose-phosphate pyrophosphokinase